MPKQSAPEAQQPLTKEQIATAERERKELGRMLVPPAAPAGQAMPGAPPVTYVEPALPASPPAPAVPVDALTALRKEKQAQIDALVLKRREAKAALAEQQANAAELIRQLKADEIRLAGEAEAHERQVGQIQSELAAAEARALAAHALKDQAARQDSERLPLEQWRAKFREALQPLVARIVSGLAKLRATLRDNGATLEQVAALRSQPGLGNELRSEYIAVSEGAKQLLGALHESIRQHERALAHAEDFLPDPSSPDGKTAINGLRYELESVSGVITNRLVDIPNPRVVPPSAGIEGQTPASLDLAERVSSLLTQYASVQKRANAATRSKPELVLEIIPKDSKPRSQVMAELRGPQPEQTRAAGVPEEN